MPEEQPPVSNQPAPSKSLHRGRHRGHRGGRGRGPRRPAPAAPGDQSADQPAGVLVEETPAPEQKFPAAARVEKDSSAINRAIEEVMQVLDSLKQVSGQMEEVLELVELAERQKLGDEREIESLRRALHRLQQPRGGRGEHQRPEE